MVAEVGARKLGDPEIIGKLERDAPASDVVLPKGIIPGMAKPVETKDSAG